MPKRATDYRKKLLEDLADPEEAASYLNAARDDSPEMLLMAMRDVAEAHQMAKIAEMAGVSRESLYRMLNSSGNPTIRNFLGIVDAIDLDFTFTYRASRPQDAPKSRGSRSAVGKFTAGRRRGVGRYRKFSRRPLGDNHAKALPTQGGMTASAFSASSDVLSSALSRRKAHSELQTIRVGAQGGTSSFGGNVASLRGNAA